MSYYEQYIRDPAIRKYKRLMLLAFVCAIFASSVAVAFAVAPDTITWYTRHTVITPAQSSIYTSNIALIQTGSGINLVCDFASGDATSRDADVYVVLAYADLTSQTSSTISITVSSSSPVLGQVFAFTTTKTLLDITQIDIFIAEPLV